MRLRVHADDFGISRGVTDGILRCIDDGPVTSVSVIPNGAAFDYAMAALRARPQVSVSVHLNLIEGNALTTGKPLRQSFFGVFRADEAALRDELAAQVRRVHETVDPTATLRLDSHGHLHHVPRVFRIVRELCKTHGAAMRLVREPLFFAPGQTASGVAKHLLLNRLSARARPKLDGVPVDDWFIGVLHTGHMSAAVVEAALRRLPNDAAVEILFHPGSAIAGEERLWADQLDMAAYYFSPDRAAESERLRSPELRAVIAKWATPSR
jgi:predicted glycoside hydrolase/deacetylase ChbG (UPF0249 family)